MHLSFHTDFLKINFDTYVFYAIKNSCDIKNIVG